ncbi:hypothetical protein AB0G64_10985 [Streptomyces longwoodensis]|uniref:hypothetical protein n=1 Tax=Streptomyces longwoodensis TaxID=68231 RepID=UPI0033F3130E
MTKHVEQQVEARIAAARARAEAEKRRRQELNEARQRGLAARHAQKLRRQAERRNTVDDISPEEMAGPVGYLAKCLAHIRIGQDIDSLEVGLACAATPTQIEVKYARQIVDVLAQRLRAAS